MNRQKELSLLKADETFIFRYEPGHEETVLDAIVETANDRGNRFDWFDAAVLSFQLSKNLVEEADRLLCPQDQSAPHGQPESQNPWTFL